MSIDHAALLESVLSRAKALGADQADATIIGSTDIAVSRRLGQLEEMERSESLGLGLRVLVGGRQAIVSTSDMTEPALSPLIERAVAIARQVPADPSLSLAPEELLARTLPELDILDPDEPPAEWMQERCAEAEEAGLAVSGITNSEGASYHYGQSRITIATSHGFFGSYAGSNHSLSMSAVAGEGLKMERDYDYATVRHRGELPDAAAIGREAARLALARMNPRKVKSCQVPIVFDPRVGKQLLSTFAGAISGAAIVRGTSFLKDAMQQQIFASGITVIDDPLMPRGLASKPFDGEGVAVERLTLVENGVLNHWLLDCRSANKLDTTTNGRAARGLSAAPNPSSTNLYIENGSVSPEALRADITSGFYVTDTFGMGVNTVTGDYSQGAAGYWIENGELTFAVSEITIAGTLQEMFAGLTAANDLTFRHRANVPTLRVDSLTVAGS